MKKYLKERGIQLSDVSKVKRKAELVDLCEKGTEMKQAKLKDTEDYQQAARREITDGGW